MMPAASKVAVLGEQVDVIVEVEDECRFGPERDVRDAEAPGQRGGPHEGVGDQERGARVHDDAAEQLLDVRGQRVEQRAHEVQRPVEPHGEAVAHQLVRHVVAQQQPLLSSRCSDRSNPTARRSTRCTTGMMWPCSGYATTTA